MDLADDLGIQFYVQHVGAKCLDGAIQLDLSLIDSDFVSGRIYVVGQVVVIALCGLLTYIYTGTFY